MTLLSLSLITRHSAEAQKVCQEQTLGSTNQELLDELRTLFTSEGKLSLKIIRNAADLASPSTYRYRFGSLRNAYRLVGYAYPSKLDSIADSRRHRALMHEELIGQIAQAFPNDVLIVRRAKRRRSLLRLHSGLIVSVLVVPSALTWKQTRRWIVETVNRERRFVTLLARLDKDNSEFLDFHVFPMIDRRKRFRVSLNDDWLSRASRLSELSQFCKVVRQVQATRSSTHKGHTRLDR